MDYISSLDSALDLPEKRVISILGCTGSIGVSTLQVIAKNRDKFVVEALGGGQNYERLIDQAIYFRPKFLCVQKKELVDIVKKELSAHYNPEILWGVEGYKALATLENVNIVVMAQSGAAGLIPTISAIEKGKVVALANKESLVLAGPIIKKLCKKTKASILPVDSEHNAIFQIVWNQGFRQVEKIILTASGGPFFGKDIDFCEKVTPDIALKHPNWSMGPKITIDSATLMNKGLEVIEAYYLYGLSLDKIDVVIHRESIIHSMVEFSDGSLFAQMSVPNMEFPIGFCLGFPKRIINREDKLDLSKIKNLSFYPPDHKTFPMLSLAIDALKRGQSFVIALNASNEVAVDAFLKKEISFLDIVKINEMVVTNHNKRVINTIEDIISVDNETREITKRLIQEIKST